LIKVSGRRQRGARKLLLVRALLVPVKSFRTAKLRLSPVLSPTERAELARRLASGVLAAGGSLPRNVVCDDAEVAAWAASAGARVIWTPGLGLSGAVKAGVAVLAAEGTDVAVVAHADLACPNGLDLIGLEAGVTLVPDLRNDGTNVAAVPAGAAFAFSYGPGSFERHRAEAARLGLPCVVVHDRGLATDVDLPEDLQRLRHAAAFAF
jgi:2-phospho-L-lactate guanylyltransferase